MYILVYVYVHVNVCTHVHVYTLYAIHTVYILYIAYIVHACIYIVYITNIYSVQSTCVSISSMLMHTLFNAKMSQECRICCSRLLNTSSVLVSCEKTSF